METKPKRKYTRKVKFSEPLETVIESVTTQAEQIFPTTSFIEEPIEKVQEVVKSEPFFVTRGYPSVELFIYYKGQNIDTLYYIKDFQVILDSKGIGSQIQLVSDRNELVGLNNAYHSVSDTTNWTDMCLFNGILALKINERPRLSPQELYDLVKNCSSYKDDFVELIQLH